MHSGRFPAATIPFIFIGAVRWCTLRCSCHVLDIEKSFWQQRQSLNFKFDCEADTKHLSLHAPPRNTMLLRSPAPTAWFENCPPDMRQAATTWSNVSIKRGLKKWGRSLQTHACWLQLFRVKLFGPQSRNAQSRYASPDPRPNLSQQNQ